MASMKLPLPISSGRGYAPSMELSYSSGAGNGTFGVGWGVSQRAIARRTSSGVPQYIDDDQFVGPDGEVLEPERGSDGKVTTTSTSTYGSLNLGDTYEVTRYYPRIEGSFDRIERWTGQAEGNDFWLIHGSDGQLHCLGKTTAARIADPSIPTHIAVWLSEESVSPNGEHIYFAYRPEDDSGIDTESNEGLRDRQANRYLTEVSYGNVTPSADLFLFGTTAPKDQAWLFSLVFDYGARGVEPGVPPGYGPGAGNTWPVRQDAFSSYHFGFEVRTHRLCRQVLMFHHFADELGLDGQGEANTLVARLLLEYDENPVLTRLTGAQRLAYEADGTVQQLPPMDLNYSPFEFSPDPAQWQIFDAFPGLNDGHPYQLVDLHGEGIAGVLYRAGELWYYRAPMRADTGGDTVTYDDWQPLPSIPAMQPERMGLMDIDGDGKLDWIVAQPGLAGFFTINPDGTWSGFTPFNALPVEFFQPQAKLVDLSGGGMPDIAMIGPRSVRLYANQRSGFDAGADVDQTDDLPIAGRDARELVGFSDMLGSGQQHLVRIRHDGVTVWPNLGRGHFGTPFQLAGLTLDETTFNPEQVYLADLDGSGAADLIYADSDAMHIWFNQAGNSLDGPFDLPWPAGVRFDRLCQLSVADVQGLGLASLVLTQPYLDARHWCYHFADLKPYLLNGINSNMGANTEVMYRSSAQEWLDEKKQEDGSALSALPFPMQLVSAVTSTDEITGNVLSQSYLYRRGVYDGREQEFRGFGYIEAQDTNKNASSTDDAIPFAPPLQSRFWYHTGREQDETHLYGMPYHDDAAFPVNSTRLTQYDATAKQDVVLDSPDDTTRFWLYRALKGSTLRSEVYGLDGGDHQSFPYSVATFRYQVRQVQATASGCAAISMPVQLEQLSYGYERIATDPQVAQQVVLGLDEYGVALWEVSVNYPRRARPAASPYPDTLPSTSWSSSYDSQQLVLRLNETRSSVWHLTQPQQWRLRLPSQQRANVLTYADADVPVEGLSFESLTSSSGLMASSRPRIYAGQSVVVYGTNEGTPDFLALIDHTETAELDESCLAAYDGILDADTLVSRLLTAGYVSSPTVLAVGEADEAPVWIVQQNFVTYGDGAAFYFPVSHRRTMLTGQSTSTYDSHYCVVERVQDAVGNNKAFEYDYRFLQPVRMTDINGNFHEVQLDALGRAIATSFYGTENAEATGFGSVADFPVSYGQSVATAVANAGTSAQHLASICAYDPFSWMGQVSQAGYGGSGELSVREWARLLSLRFITAQGHIRASGRRWISSKASKPELTLAARQVLASAPRTPVNSAILLADRYPDDPGQQVRVTVSYSDGFGRPLQTVSKAPAGPAWQRTDSGEIACDDNGEPVEATADPRWTVSGRVEYDNKGQVVRTYQPYFIDDWQYVVDSSMQVCGFADTHYYDPVGREIQVVTALNYLRRQSFYPWFSVMEDENDTLAEVSAS
ncbi:toxin [Paraburkholderia sp. D15]|uniref:SpvB/TcaC N-terminal domain-containing protein n=1 Tax=Paraburkholderia sp. D15 TaxID=2880218 RepID=UPI00247AB88F|nr:SpvB/TcaC N-terminal domain-containing protein [Paraburkholderia sp. D15]WGS48265.1 toxin [Paraburkholderia sp. D15]